MNKLPSLTAKSILLAFTLIAICAFSTLLLRAQANQEINDQQDPQTEAQAESQSSHGRWRELQAQRLEGSWEAVVTPVVPPGVPQPPSFHAYSTYARGGAGTGSDRTRPFSKQHIAWTHLGGNHFAATQKEDLFDAMGNFDGILTVRQRLTITGKDEYVGVANGERRDANGNLVFSRCTTVKGTRIKVEPLPTQCQNITPPQ